MNPPNPPTPGSQERAGLAVRRAALAAAATMVLATAAPTLASDLSTDIESLLARVSRSDCDFLRNGKAHGGAEAARHMDRKYRHFRDEITSIEQFIDKAGTKSLMSGRPYTVRCPGAQEMKTAAWLKALLDDSYREAGTDAID